MVTSECYLSEQDFELRLAFRSSVYDGRLEVELKLFSTRFAAAISDDKKLKTFQEVNMNKNMIEI